MGKIFTALAMAAAVSWPVTVPADGNVPERGMNKAEVRAQFGKPGRVRPAVGQPPISRWDYDGFSVYFENDTTLHSVREQQRAPAAEAPPPGDTQGEEPGAHSTLEADLGVSPANGKEPPTEKEEQETNIEVETFHPPRNKDDEDDEASSESDSAPGTTSVRAQAEGSGERTEEDDAAGDANPNGAAKNSDAGEGRFRFDPATGRIIVDDPQEGEDSDASPAR
jgi:hypothetical protein